MRHFPAPIQELISDFCRLPGVGPKTALRYIYALLNLPKEEIQRFGQRIGELPTRIRLCDRCAMQSEETRCRICSDSRRNPAVLCVVETSRDIATIEATGAFDGRYFVFGGTLNPLEGRVAETLRGPLLYKRLEAEPAIAEVILAFSPDIDGETTMLALARLLAPLKRTLTRLARGLPMGASLEFADDVTLSDALRGRQKA